MSLEYERLVLRWIAREYEAQGYRVTFEWTLPSSDFRFDALAERASDGAIVLIELIDARHAGRRVEERVRALERFAEAFPNARVDLRRLDYEMPTWLMRAVDRPDASTWDLGEFLNLRLNPALVPDAPVSVSGIDIARQLTTLWTLHAATLRAYSEHWRGDGGDARSVLALYNELLASDRLKAPEDVSDDVRLDLFQLFDAVMAVMNGASARPEDVQQLHGHWVSVRQQIFEKLVRPDR